MEMLRVIQLRTLLSRLRLLTKAPSNIAYPICPTVHYSLCCTTALRALSTSKVLSHGRSTKGDLQFLEISLATWPWHSTRSSCWPPKRPAPLPPSVEAIHSAVALPVDDILNDAVNVMEALHWSSTGCRPAAPANPAKCPRYQTGDPKSRPGDGAH